MSLIVLPVELLDSIFHHVADADLVALSSACSALSPVAQRLLYRHISVSPSFRNFRVVKTLAERADIASYVRSFSISIGVHAPAFPSFYRLLMNAVANMTEIISLDLFVDSLASWLLKGTAPNVIYSRLHRFTCSFPFDSRVAAFLERTPALLELELDSTPVPHNCPVPSLPSTSVPRLVHFVGSARVAKALVPGRPLQSIHLHEGDVAEDDIIRLAQATAHVVILEVTTGALPVPFLTTLSRHMPYLAYLRVMTTYQFSKAPDVDFCERVANALGSLPDLTAFELSGIHWGSCQDSDGSRKRVWQSKPFSDSFQREDVEIPISSDIFLAY